MSAETQPIADPPTADPLRITGVRIANFRAFENLLVEPLKRVNLITGRNNTGKSTLLEAIFLHVDGGSSYAYNRIIRLRDEYDYLHHCTHSSTDDRSYIQSPLHETTVVHGSVNDSLPRTSSLQEFGGNFLIGTQKLDPESIAALWKNVQLTPDEDWVVEALQIILPRVAKARLIEVGNQKIPHALLKGESKPVPLSQLGEGMNRLFGMALALVNCRGGVLLIDEFENGLHYSVQIDIWKMIFQTARRLDVQVFATTHSWDCIEAFTQVAIEDAATDGQLVKLGRVGGQVVATHFDEESLATVTKQHVEVR